MGWLLILVFILRGAAVLRALPLGAAANVDGLALENILGCLELGDVLLYASWVSGFFSIGVFQVLRRLLWWVGRSSAVPAILQCAESH